MQTGENSIHVSVRDQSLTLRRGAEILRRYPISTSQFGVGSEEGSQKTPQGQFRIAEKIGGDAAIGTVFKSRRPVETRIEDAPEDDLILSRILWLDGVEEANANTRGRFIYIHGTNHEDRIGEPASHGCIRMKNADLIELFDLVSVDTAVRIDA